jgi:hypothetical protein
MAEITKIYKQEMPAVRLIGMKYGDEDRVDGGFGSQWGEWFEKGRFDKLEALNPTQFFEDSGAYIGLMRWKKDEPFQYWIGMFFPAGTDLPEGFAGVDFSASTIGVAWLYGKDGEVYAQEHVCAKALGEQGMSVASDVNDADAWWFFERYVCPRFTEPDEKGNITLDVCHFVK